MTFSYARVILYDVHSYANWKRSLQILDVLTNCFSSDLKRKELDSGIFRPIQLSEALMYTKLCLASITIPHYSRFVLYRQESVFVRSENSIRAVSHWAG